MLSRQAMLSKCSCVLQLVSDFFISLGIIGWVFSLSASIARDPVPALKRGALCISIYFLGGGSIKVGPWSASFWSENPMAKLMAVSACCLQGRDPFLVDQLKVRLSTSQCWSDTTPAVASHSLPITAMHAGFLSQDASYRAQSHLCISIRPHHSSNLYFW